MMKNITTDQAKDTGMAMVLICLLVMLFYELEILLVPAVILLVVTMTFPVLLRPVGRLWFGFSHIMGSIVSKILLSVLFFVIVTPIGLARRFAGADSLKLKDWRKGTPSAFVDCERKYSAEDLEHPY